MSRRKIYTMAVMGCALAILILASGGCSLSPVTDRYPSHALSASEANKTSLGQAVSKSKHDKEGTSGVYMMGDPQLAFASRMLLFERAEKTIDLQYYIWDADVTGTLMFEALLSAANRNVRVRLLLDDNGINELDDALYTLSNHPNIDVRIFNPFVQRQHKWLGYITHFTRVNRRMHNKSFTVDNVVTVIGGRNIADDYFGATQHVLKEDIDVLAVGDIVGHVSSDFDRYWASQSAYPITQLVNNEHKAVYSTAMLFPEQSNNPRRQEYITLIKQSSIIDTLAKGTLAFSWSEVKLISDSPQKTLNTNNDEDLLVAKLHEALGVPTKSVLIVSPYFVPTPKAVSHFTALAKQGIAVNILTNSMMATDVLPVHAGYAKHRKTLLNAGVSLFELKPTRADSNKLKDKLGPFGSSASSLHAKMFVIDDKRLFIGSFNFDPRSININTELGFIIYHEELTTQVNTQFAENIDSAAYALSLDESGDIVWHETVNGNLIAHTREPGSGVLNNFALSILSILPINSLL